MGFPVASGCSGGRFFLLLSIVISWVVLLIRSRLGCKAPPTGFYLESAPALSFLSLPAWPAWRVELFVVFFLTTALVSFGILMGFFIDTNSFSLHATYRNRLIRAYLAASCIEDTRRENPFTGFDPKDDFKLNELCSQKPLHVINVTLNLVKGKELAWQERKAESFTMSRCTVVPRGLVTGPPADVWQGYFTRYRARYFGRRRESQYGLPFLARGPFLDDPALTCAWAGGSGIQEHRAPKRGISRGPLVFGWAAVFRGDGQHDRSLQIRKSFRRRAFRESWAVRDGAAPLPLHRGERCGRRPGMFLCRLGEAVRKIRVDFGIPIEFEPMTIYPRSAIRHVET